MKPYLLLSAIILLSCLAYGQTTKLKIKLNLEYAIGANVRIMVEGKEFFRAVDQNREVEIDVPLLEKNVPLYVKLTSVGYQEKVWQNSFDFNGSGNAKITLAGTGVSGFEQWPVIEFESASGTLDVYINGNSIGSTKRKKGVEPNKEHTLVWKKDTDEKCTKKVNLPPNVNRKYVCDGNGNITEN
jgi:hypothetical protein